MEKYQLYGTPSNGGDQVALVMGFFKSIDDAFDEMAAPLLDAGSGLVKIGSCAIRVDAFSAFIVDREDS